MIRKHLKTPDSPAIVFAGSVLAIALLLATACDDRQGGFTVHDGSRITAKQMAGKLVLINYWALWCAPCRWEIPDLNRFQEENRDRVLVLGVNYDAVTGAALKEQIAAMDIRFAVLDSDPGQYFGAEPVDILPYTLVIDGAGDLVQILRGPQSIDSLQKLLSTSAVASP